MSSSILPKIATGQPGSASTFNAPLNTADVNFSMIDEQILSIGEHLSSVDVALASSGDMLKSAYASASSSIVNSAFEVAGAESGFVSGDDIISHLADESIHSINLPSGISLDFFGLSAPDGWLLEDGKTIGNSVSGATARAAADTENLFTLIWNSSDNTNFPIQDSTGAASTRGASAAADYASGKRIPLPDSRGRSTIGYGQGVGLSNRSSMGAKGGEETHALTSDENGQHAHIVDFSATNAGNGPYIGPSSYANVWSRLTSSSGNGTAHNNMSPFIVKNKIIKL